VFRPLEILGVLVALPGSESRKCEGGREKRGKTGWKQASKVNQLPLPSLAPLPSTDLL
jgi:hypothetical protein